MILANMIKMIVAPCAAWRHRFRSALRAEPLLVHTLSRMHLVSTLSRLRQRRSVSTKCFGRNAGTKCTRRSVLDEVQERNVGTKCRDVCPATPLLHTPCCHDHARKAASHGIPLAAALQICSPDSRSIGIEINCLESSSALFRLKRPTRAAPPRPRRANRKQPLFRRRQRPNRAPRQEPASDSRTP